MQQLSDIFAEAIRLPPHQRESLIAVRCRQKPQLSDEVRSLLAHHDRAEGFLDSSCFQGRARFLPTRISNEGMVDPRANPTSSLRGTKIGGYTLLKCVGHGGMGTVYLAQQAQPNRLVAIKLIQPGAFSEPALRRFAAEAEALGRLHHPGIAQIFEAGSAPVELFAPNPVPFIAMEYVPGPTLTDYVAAAQPSTRQVIELAIQICQAVHHAHQRGVIHRDLKPGNILVGTCDAGTVGEATAGPSHVPTFPPSHAAAQPKILDFGVARVTGGDAHATAHTAPGQFIGTLAYMSPEQVSGGPDDVDTRCDVYALGVLLYQLLAGRLPIDHTGRTLSAAMQAIRDEIPPKLGTLRRELRGDVETIVARALKQDRERRYASAGDLAEDLRRFLAGEAIEARRDSALYVLRKGLRRYRGLVAGAFALVLALAGFAAYATLEAARFAKIGASERAAREAAASAAGAAHQAAERANAARDEALAFSSLLKGVIELARPDAGRGYERRITDVLDAATERVNSGALADQPQAEAQVREMLAKAYWGMALHDPTIVHQKWLAEYHRQRNGERSEAYIRALLALGTTYTETGRMADGEPHLRRAFELAQEVHVHRPASILRITSILGNCLMRQECNEEALPFSLAAADGYARITGEGSEATAVARFNLAGVYRNLGRREETAELYAQILPVLVDRGTGPGLAVRVRRYYARDVLLRSGRFAEAEQYLRETVALSSDTLGGENPETLASIHFLAQALRAQGQTAEASELLADSFKIFSSVAGSTTVGEFVMVKEFVACLTELCEFDRAADVLRTEIERFSRLRGASNTQTVQLRELAAALEKLCGQPRAAVDLAAR